jgi:hypothetical protein
MNSRSVIILAAVALAVLLTWEFLPSSSTITPSADRMPLRLHLPRFIP